MTLRFWSWFDFIQICWPFAWCMLFLSALIEQCIMAYHAHSSMSKCPLNLGVWKKMGMSICTICTLHTEVTKIHRSSTNKQTKKDSAVRILSQIWIHVRWFSFCSPAPTFQRAKCLEAQKGDCLKSLEYIPHASFMSEINYYSDWLFWWLKPSCSNSFTNRWLKTMICFMMKNNQQITLKQIKLFFFQTWSLR